MKGSVALSVKSWLWFHFLGSVADLGVREDQEQMGITQAWGDVVRLVDLLLPGGTEVRPTVRSMVGSVACPGCGWRSSCVHCYYRRCLADRPVAGRQVILDLRARRRVCGNGTRECRTFAEQIPDLTRRHMQADCSFQPQQRVCCCPDQAVLVGGCPAVCHLFRLVQPAADLRAGVCRGSLRRSAVRSTGSAAAHWTNARRWAAAWCAAGGFLRPQEWSVPRR